VEPSTSPPRPPRPDLDFAPDPFPPSPLPTDFAPLEHQRLIVNPFLAVVALIAWAWLTLQLFATSFPPLALLPTLIFGLLPILIHTHCLDCGATGIYPRWWKHACPKVIIRARANRRGWFPWPSARTQLILWGYILGAFTLLLVVLGAGALLILGRG